MLVEAALVWSDERRRLDARQFDELMEHLAVPSFLEEEAVFRLAAHGVELRDAVHRVRRLHPQRPSRTAFDHRLLGAGEEQRLGLQIRRGLEAEALLSSAHANLTAFEQRSAEDQASAGIEAQGQLVAHNIRLAASIARTLRRPAAPFLDEDDLICEAVTGLIHAARKFDFSKGFRFSTYATWWIRQAVWRAIHNQRDLIRLPVHAHETWNWIRRTEAELDSALSDEEAACALDLPLAAIRSIRAAQRPVQSLETVLHAGWYEPVSESEADAVVDDVFAEQRRRLVFQRLDDMDTRYRLILERRWGYLDDREWTLEEIGEVLGVTRERVRQLEKKAVEAIRSDFR